MLPKANSTTEKKSAWKSFEEINNKFNSIEVGKTTKQELYSLGFEPFKGANGRILTYTDVIPKFMPSDHITLEDIPSGIRQCIKVQEKCFVFTIDAKDIDKNRTGNFWADVFMFVRQTDTTGWTFNGYFIVVDDIVAYKLMSGTPNQFIRDRDRKPLGPLQGIGKIVGVE